MIAGGVLWSNVDQYHDVWLAPRGQLHDLETIGHRFAGDGPALMTDYEPYGARHFLRSLDPEGASELRRRYDYLANGKSLDKGDSADIDRFRLDQVLVYRTLVLRRGRPRAGRRRSTARLERPLVRGLAAARAPDPDDRAAPAARRASQAAAVPSCAAIKALRGSLLVAAERPQAIGLGNPPARGTQL